MCTLSVFMQLYNLYRGNLTNSRQLETRRQQSPQENQDRLTIVIIRTELDVSARGVSVK